MNQPTARLWRRLLPLVGLLLLLTACGGPARPDAEEPLPPVQDPAGQDPAADPPEPFTQDGQRYLPVDAGLLGERIAFSAGEDGLELTEEFLELGFREGERYVYRRGYIVDAMWGPALLREGTWYLPESFCRRLLAPGSLFPGVTFFPDEIREALEDPEAEGSRALLAAIELPRSMGIEIPNIDPDRVFSLDPMADLPAELRQELGWLMGGEGDADGRVYGEYTTLLNARSLDAAGLRNEFLGEPALAGEDPETWTAGQYKRWAGARREEERIGELSPEEQAFLTEKGILPADFFWIYKTYPGNFMDRSDEELRSVLTEYYQMALNYATAE